MQITDLHTGHRAPANPERRAQPGGRPAAAEPVRMNPNAAVGGGWSVVGGLAAARYDDEMDAPLGE
jgi:hypothetical protein